MSAELKLELTVDAAREIISELVYEHLLELVDWERISRLEEIISMKFLDLADAEVIRDPAQVHLIQCLATEIIEEAWHRVVKDERRFFQRLELQPDDDCELCQELAHPARISRGAS